MAARFYRVDQSEHLIIQFQLQGASHYFVDDPVIDDTKLHTSGVLSVTRIVFQPDLLSYDLVLDPDRAVAVVTPHIWVTAAEPNPPADAICKVALSQTLQTLTAYIPPTTKDPFTVTESIGPDELSQLLMPTLYLTRPPTPPKAKAKGGAK